jgi:hypothetical protein
MNVYLCLVDAVLQRCVGVLVEVWLVDVISVTGRARDVFDPGVGLCFYSGHEEDGRMGLNLGFWVCPCFSHIDA